jgi:hypothetical protein
MSMAASRPASEPAIVVVGVSGCGMPYVEPGFAETLGLRFVEAAGLRAILDPTLASQKETLR